MTRRKLAIVAGAAAVAIGVSISGVVAADEPTGQVSSAGVAAAGPAYPPEIDPATVKVLQRTAEREVVIAQAAQISPSLKNLGYKPSDLQCLAVLESDGSASVGCGTPEQVAKGTEFVHQRPDGVREVVVYMPNPGLDSVSFGSSGPVDLSNGIASGLLPASEDTIRFSGPGTSVVKTIPRP